MTGKKAAWMIAAGVTLAGLESGAPPLGARHEVVQPVATTLRVQQINPTTRSLMDTPEASIKQDILSVSFDASDICSFYIEDCFGTTAYSGAFPADGMEYSYDLTGIGEGLFRLVIVNQRSEYEGSFKL